MAARLGWWLSHGDAVTVADVAQALYNVGRDEYDRLDCQTRKAWRRRARCLLRQIARVLPVVDDGEVWQAIEATPSP
jgi:hypothetical protein